MKRIFLSLAILCTSATGQAQYQLPESISVEGIPDIPQSLAERMTQYQNARSAFLPLSESVQMKEKLKQQGNTVWCMEMANEGHGFQKKKRFLRKVQGIISKTLTHLGRSK